MDKSPFQLSPAQSCRVEMVNPPSTVPTGQTQYGYYSWVSPQTGTTYALNGMTISDFNRGLRLPQQRTYLGPEYFNSGCITQYCKDSENCPNSVPATTSKCTSAMFDAVFSSTFPHTGNSAPPACFEGKCVSYNSTLGWQYNANSTNLTQGAPKLAWQV